LVDTLFCIDPREELIAIAMAQYMGAGSDELPRLLRAGV
jgi:hypothetical protein